MTLDEFRKNTKGLSKEETDKYINSLSKEEIDVISDLIIEQHKINYVFKDDDFTTYTEDEKKLNKRVDELREAISNYNQKELYYTIDSLLNPRILRVLAHCIKDPSLELDETRLNHLIDRYNEINDFINNDENHKEILGFYGDIVYKDDNGFYQINNSITNKILKDNDFKVSDKDDLNDIKDIINLTWENKKEILDPYEINDISEKQNGINFKEFLFCEEYLKRGKIKPTCECLGISRNTAYLWLKDNKVQDYLTKRQEEIKRETDDTFLQTYRASFNQLNKMINSSYLDSGDKLKAIDIFLKHYENIERLKLPNTTYED